MTHAPASIKRAANRRSRIEPGRLNPWPTESEPPGLATQFAACAACL